MSVTEYATDQPVTSQPVSSQSLKHVLVGFAATVTVGLALGSWYVGVRIVARVEPASLPAISVPTVPEAIWHPVPAPRYDLYLQVAGLGPRRDLQYVKRLRRQGFHAVVRISNTEKSARILIGPFADSPALEKARRILQAAGVLAGEGTY